MRIGTFLLITTVLLHPAASLAAPPAQSTAPLPPPDGGGAGKPSPPPSDKSERPRPFNNSALNGLFARYVRSGLVDYAAWKKDGTKELDGVVQTMSAFPYTRVLAREHRLAFLINAYNALVIRSVLTAYPVGSVKDIPGFFDVKKHALGGNSYTLDEIEKNLIHATFQDMPNYHFALVPGAIGGPPLRNTAYNGDSLGIQMSLQLQGLMSDSTRSYMDSKEYVLHLTEIFKWHASDFEHGDQTIPRYLVGFFPLGIAMKMLKEEPQTVYIPFNWGLNDVSAARWMK